MDKKSILKSIIREKDVDGLIISDTHSLRYYTGFSGEGFAIVTENVSIILTDSR